MTIGAEGLPKWKNYVKTKKKNIFDYSSWLDLKPVFSSDLTRVYGAEHLVGKVGVKSAFMKLTN